MSSSLLQWYVASQLVAQMVADHVPGILDRIRRNGASPNITRWWSTPRRPAESRPRAPTLGTSLFRCPDHVSHHALGREAVSRFPAAKVQHIQGSDLDPQIDRGSHHLPDTRLHPLGDVHVHASASPVGSQRQRQLRKPRIVYHVCLRPERHFSGDRYHHGRHASVHLAESEHRLADKVLCRSNNGAWFAVSCCPFRAIDAGLAVEADNKDDSACIVTLIRFKYIRDFSISEDLTCKQTPARIPHIFYVC